MPSTNATRPQRCASCYGRSNRLRLLVLRANQLQVALDGCCAVSTEFILDIFRRELQGEPCVAERREWEKEFFGPPRAGKLHHPE